MPHLGDRNMELLSCLLTMILFDAGRGGYWGSNQGESGGRQKNAGLKAATLISVSNPVSQVLW
jgi:hypothetical protein